MAAHYQRSDLDGLRQQAREDPRVCAIRDRIADWTLADINTCCNNLLQWLQHRGQGHFEPVGGDDIAAMVGYGRLLNAGLLDDLVAEIDRRARDRSLADRTVEHVMALGKELLYPAVRVGHLKPPSMATLQLWGPQSNVFISPSFLVEDGGPGEGPAEWERWQWSGRAPEDAPSVLEAIHRKWPDLQVEWPPVAAAEPPASPSLGTTAPDKSAIAPETHSSDPSLPTTRSGRLRLENDPRVLADVRRVDDALSADNRLTKRAALARVGMSEDTYYEVVKRLRAAARYPLTESDPFRAGRRPLDS